MKKPALFFRQSFLQVARRRKRGWRGQTLIEYCLILAFVVIVTISLVVVLSQQTTKLYSSIGSNMNRMGS